jgi:sulfate transport system ATP-binding protein
MSIQIKSVTKTFGKFKALDDVSLEVRAGELVALLGPSGSGKTTLLRIIGGIESPDQGRVFIHEQDSLRLTAAHRRVGFVFQHYALFKNMSVFENVAFGLRVKPRKERPSDQAIKDKVMELLHLVQLENMAKRFPMELSGGQRQRVALARALAIEPKVLLLDEPFGALDAKVRRDLRHWLRRLHDEIHVTSIFVTHDQEEALEVADRVAVLNEGKIQQIGTPDEVYHRPANAFVYHFLGNVNLFHCRVEGGKAFFGDVPLDLQSQNVGGKTTATVYIRPHLLEIERTSQSRRAVQAQIKHINAAGPVVRIELMDGQNTIHAELTHERFHQLSLKIGEQVFVSPKEKKVFVDDYSI